MLALLLVVAGKLFVVQGLDVGAWRGRPQQQAHASGDCPLSGSILDSSGTVLASSVIRYNVVVDQTVSTKTESFRGWCCPVAE